MNHKFTGLAALGLLMGQPVSHAACNDVTREMLVNAMIETADAKTGGYGLNMWVTMVDETGKVCYLITQGEVGKNLSDTAWLGARLISAQKANTANAFSYDSYVISSANLYAAVQPGGALFGLQASNPINQSIAYIGDPMDYGTVRDPMVGQRLGGISVYGGGLAIYKEGRNIGAIGVSGDTSCRDHAFAWRVRKHMGLEPSKGTQGITTANMDIYGKKVASLPDARVGDEMILTTVQDSKSYWASWAQPACPNSLDLGEEENKKNGILVVPN